MRLSTSSWQHRRKIYGEDPGRTPTARIKEASQKWRGNGETKKNRRSLSPHALTPSPEQRRYEQGKMWKSGSLQQQKIFCFIQTLATYRRERTKKNAAAHRRSQQGANKNDEDNSSRGRQKQRARLRAWHRTRVTSSHFAGDKGRLVERSRVGEHTMNMSKVLISGPLSSSKRDWREREGGETVNRRLYNDGWNSLSHSHTSTVGDGRGEGEDRKW